MLVLFSHLFYSVRGRVSVSCLEIIVVLNTLVSAINN